MTAKEHLYAILELNGQINTKLERLSCMRCAAASTRGIDYTGDRVQVSAPPEAAFTGMVDQAVALDAEINGDIDRLADLKTAAGQMISGLPDAQHDVLMLRYLNCMAWHDVADVMGCTVRHAFRIHKDALHSLEEQDVVD